MGEFKQWHNERMEFNNETMVYFSQCGANKKMSLGELLKITSDTAVEDWAERGMSREVLANHGVAILVSRCSFRIHKMPSENERIVTRTWEEKSEPLQFVRAYEILGADGTKRVSGISTWLLVDINARKILPIKKFDEMNLRVPTDRKSEHDCFNAGKIVVGEGTELWDERVIKHSDIDSNSHTNNARYGAFVADALSEKYFSKNFTDFRINYAKEAMLGETLRIFGKADEESKKLSLVGQTDAGISFEAELFWKD